MKIKSQSGFTLVEGLLLIIALSLIAFIGVYVYNSQHKTSQTLNTATKAAQQKTTVQVQSTLAIKELGIKIKLPADLIGLKYTVSTADNSKDASFTLARYTKEVENCRASQSADFSAVIGTVSRYEGNYDASASPNSVFSEFAKQLPGFYLEYGNPDGGYCDKQDSDSGKKVQTLFTDINTQLKDAVKNAEAL
jgi:type II secretory pathway pseudopilin PulG